MRHGRQMQRAVGRAAGCGHDTGGVFKRFHRANVARANVLREQFHHLHAGGMGDLVTRGVGCRRHIGIGERQANRFGDTGHGVRRILATTRTVAGTGHLFERMDFFNGAGAGGIFPDDFKHIDNRHITVLIAARKDRSAIDEDRWHIEPQHRHHHAGERLVTARKGHQRVVAMPAHRQLDRIRNDFTADERGLHPLMAHGDAVGHGDGVEATRHAAADFHAHARNVRLMVERRVAGSRIVTGRGNADKWPRNFFLGQPHRIIIAAVGRALRPHGHMAAG